MLNGKAGPSAAQPFKQHPLDVITHFPTRLLQGKHLELCRHPALQCIQPPPTITCPPPHPLTHKTTLRGMTDLYFSNCLLHRPFTGEPCLIMIKEDTFSIRPIQSVSVVAIQSSSRTSRCRVKSQECSCSCRSHCPTALSTSSFSNSLRICASNLRLAKVLSTMVCSAHSKRRHNQGGVSHIRSDSSLSEQKWRLSLHQLSASCWIALGSTHPFSIPAPVRFQNAVLSKCCICSASKRLPVLPEAKERTAAALESSDLSARMCSKNHRIVGLGTSTMPSQSEVAKSSQMREVACLR